MHANDLMRASEPTVLVRIRALGDLEIIASGSSRRSHGARARKPRELLMGLVAAGVRGIAQHLLCEALWPEAEGDAAYRALITTVYRLRRLLQCRDAVSFAGGRVALSAAHCWVDAWVFDQALSAAALPADAVPEAALASEAALARALALYRGALCGDAEAPLVFEARERLRRRFVRAVLARGQRLLGAGAAAAAIELYEQALEVEGGCEDLHRALILAQAGNGHTAAAASAYERCRAALRTRFGMVPSVATERAWRESCKPQAGPRQAGYAFAAYPTTP
jgi:LuxR family transcriptional regulator, maltose regulon positive regulatory protein